MAATVGSVLLVACAVPASSGRVGGVERSVFEAINGLGLDITTVAGGHGASEPWPPA